MNSMVHLHVHTDASFLDGMILPKNLVKRAKDLGMPAVAVTDHGNMSNIIEFYREATEAGIKPILGCEVYVEDEVGSSHLVLLAKNNDGYKRLNKLVFDSYHNFYRKPRIKREWLQEDASGLIALSACLSGVVSKAIKAGRGEEEALLMKSIFGDDFYLEVQANKIPAQRVLNEKIYVIAEKLSIKVVGTIDAHFLMKEDRDAHKHLLKIPNMKVSATYTEAYLKSREEMMDELPAHVLDNTLEVAEKCNVVLDTSTKMPVYSKDQAEEFRRILTDMGPKRTPWTQEYKDRLKYEISVIEKMDYQGYFMVLYDVITWAKKNHILTSPGRGSAAGSLVSHVMGITDLDPIEHGLIFERFLNPDRVSLPDVDLDIPKDKRADVLAYVESKYGSEYVAKIMAMSKLKPRSAFKDIARIKNIPFNESNRIAATINQDAKTMAEAADMSEEFKSYYHAHLPMMEVCEKLIGVTRQATVHAAGVVISPVPILDVVTMKYDKEAGQVIAVDKDAVEYIGLVKMDFLGLDTLTIIDKTGIDVSNVDLNDPKVIELFREGNTDAVFQFESDGMKKLLIDMEVSSFNDIVAANALYRPGPLENGMAEEYVRNKKTGNFEVPFDDLKDVLAPTYGVLAYQEDVIKSAVVIGGISLADGDILRKAIGKKNEALMNKIIKKIKTVARKNGRDMDAVDKFFDKVKKFAHYSFNKSHAAAYAKLAVQTAYLKAYYPAKFFAAAMAVWDKKTDKVYRLILSARREGIDVVPPDINVAEKDATPIGNYGVMLGLTGIKGVGASAVSDIIANRPYKSLFDFMAKVPSSTIANTKALISIGVFDAFGHRREDLDLSADVYAKRIKNGGRNILVAMAMGKGEIDQPVERSIETWTDKKRMEKEFSSFGFYLTETPLDKYNNVMSLMSYRKLSVIEHMKLTHTRKSKEEMAIVKLTDYIDSEEYPIFPRMWEEVGNKIKVGDVVLTKYDDDGFIVSIVPVDGDIKPKRIIITVDNSSHIENINHMFSHYPGEFVPTMIIEGEESPSISSIRYDLTLMQLLNKIPGVSATAVF